MLILKGDVGVLFKVPDDLYVACLLDYCNEYSHTQQTLNFKGRQSIILVPLPLYLYKKINW